MAVTLTRSRISVRQSIVKDIRNRNGKVSRYDKYRLIIIWRMSANGIGKLFDKRNATAGPAAAVYGGGQAVWAAPGRLHNTLTGGHTWVEGGTDRAAVEKRMALIKEFMPEVYGWVSANLDRAVENGWLKSLK